MVFPQRGVSQFITDVQGSVCVDCMSTPANLFYKSDTQEKTSSMCSTTLPYKTEHN